MSSLYCGYAGVRRNGLFASALAKLSFESLDFQVYSITVPEVLGGTGRGIYAWDMIAEVYVNCPQHFLNFLPLPHGHFSLRPTFRPWTRFCFGTALA